MANISNLATSFILFAVLATLMVTTYGGIETYYGINESSDSIKTLNGTTGNIAYQFQELYLIEGITNTTKGITDLQAPNNPIDVIGGLISVGIGSLKVVAGIIIMPYQISNIVVSNYYVNEIPGIVAGLLSMIIVYVTLIVLAVFLRRDRI